MMRKYSDRTFNMLGPRWQWLPCTSKTTQQILKKIYVRGRIGRKGRQNLKIGFLRPMSRTLITAGFHPLNLQWYFPHYAATQLITVNNITRHAYVAGTVAGSKWLSTPHRSVLPNENNLVVTRAQSPIDIRHRVELVQNCLGHNQIQSGASISTDQGGNTQAYTSFKWYNYAGQRDRIVWSPVSLKSALSLMLAVSPKPRREMSPASFRGADHDLIASQLPQAEHRLEWEGDFQTQTASPVQTNRREMDSSSFVNELFDRAVQSQLLPGMELQFLPLASTQGRIDSEPSASGSEFNSSTKRADRRPLSDSNKPPTPISREDVNRVADRVAQVLAKRQRFERERLGGV